MIKIQSINTIKNKPKYTLVYAVSGMGKTSLVKTLPGNVLILDAENGLASLKNHATAGKVIDHISLNTAEDGSPLPEKARFELLTEFMDLVKSPETKKKYDTLFIDSLTEIGQTVQKHMKQVHGDDGFKVWGEYTNAMVELLKFFRDLNHYDVVFTALEERIDSDDAPSYFFPAIGGKKMKEYLMPCFDEVYRMIVDEDKNRLFVCQPTPKTQAKNRLGGLDPIEPANLGKIAVKIKGESK